MSVIVEKSAEMQTGIDLGWRMGDVMYGYFWQEGLRSELKQEDLTIVTEADLDISDQVIAFYRATGRGVVSEERGRTAEYGALDAEYLDPIDGTKDFDDNREGADRQSIGAFSLGSVVGGHVVRGVVNMPILHVPRLYWAEEGRGAYRVMKKGGAETQLHVDPTITKGAILVSENSYPHIDRLAAKGMRVIRLGGAVFKACSVADPGLIHDFDPSLLPPGEQIIGFVSPSAAAHDYKAAERIVKSAGGFACGVDGGELPLAKGKHGCVFANSEATRDLLLEAMQAS